MSPRGPRARARLEVPDVVREKALAAGAAQWLDGLIGLQPAGRQMLAAADGVAG